jgi:transcriptional regulator with XRE-family HTH domain
VLELEYGESEEPPQLSNRISLVIARAIEQSGLSKAEVSRRMGVPRALLTRWTHPRYMGHTVDTLERIATALGGTLEVKIEVTRAA